MTITGSCHCGSTRRIGVNARLFDDFDAALATITVIDGKHLW